MILTDSESLGSQTTKSGFLPHKKKSDSYLVSDTPLSDHFLMREFVSGPPSHRSIHKNKERCSKSAN